MSYISTGLHRCTRMYVQTSFTLSAVKAIPYRLLSFLFCFLVMLPNSALRLEVSVCYPPPPSKYQTVCLLHFWLIHVMIT